MVAGFCIVTLGLVAVLWSFISSLQENAEKLGSYKVGWAWSGPKATLEGSGLDAPFLPSSEKVKGHEKSNAIFDDAESLAMRGDFAGSLKTATAALAELESEIAARGTPATETEKKILASRHGYIGKMLGHLHEDRKALDEYSKAIELNPKLPFLWSARAQEHARLNEVKEAAADQLKAQDLERHQDKRTRALNRILGDGIEAE